MARSSGGRKWGIAVIDLLRVLCVDDEPRVVDGLAVQLRKDFRILTANGGHAALRMLKEGAAPMVIVSDMRMPGMDGATLLKHVKQLYPDMTRILLTGETGRDAAVAAVNEGQIFRFLTKPCSTETLRAAIDAGVMQHRLLSAERVLLQETLIGCIKALIDILAITNPVAFGRATRLRRLSVELAGTLEIKGGYSSSMTPTWCEVIPSLWQFRSCVPAKTVTIPK